MIPVIQYLWKQLNGPQIKAICEAINQFIRSQVDDLLDYFNNLNVDTATDSHLTTIGSLIGLSRPKLTDAKIKYFLFTDGVEHNSSKGFSDGPGSESEGTRGGKLVDLNEILAGNSTVLLPAAYYRPLLNTIIESDGDYGSIVLLDDIYSTFYKIYKPTSELDYRFEWNLQATETRGVGDIDVYVGNTETWGDENIIMVDAALDALVQRGYGPDTVVYNNYS